MLEGIGAFFASLKQASPFLFLGFAIASGIILFGPDSLLATLGLAEFRTTNRAVIGVAFLLSISLLAAQAIWSIGSSTQTAFVSWWNRRKEASSLLLRQASLGHLTPDETAYLLPYIRNSENTQYFSLEDGISNGLRAKGILYRSANVGSMLNGFAFNIQPWAREYLEQHPEALEGASQKPNRPRLW